MRVAWPTAEPATQYVHGWHLDAIAEHLQAVSQGQIQRLLINMPPRHMKSLAVSVFWPAWEWITRPGLRYLCASYAQTLSTRDSVKCRRLIQSPWYQRRWADRFNLTGDQNSKLRFDTDAQGFRLATSVGGVATGEGGDRILIDDPHSATEALSDVKRASTLEWWDQSMSTRLNDPRRSAVVIVMQRLHEDDLSGHVLKQGGYVHLCLPAEYEGSKYFSTARVAGMSVEDPREVEGEPLWPERFDAADLDKIKVSLGSYGAAGQLQQRPSPKGGGIFKRAWWQFYREPPRFSRIIQSWDTAFKTGDTNAYSVGQTWGEAINGYYLLDQVRGRWEFPELKREVKAFCDKHNPSAVLIEDKASGQSLAQEIKAGSTMPVLPIPVAEGDKVVRAHVVAPTVEAGKVFIPESAEWLSDFLDELERFPASAYADQVDSFTQALEWMRREKGKLIKEDTVKAAIQAGGKVLDLKGKKVEALEV
jgi:predicted phage terminase large subunit-like protein